MVCDANLSLPRGELSVPLALRAGTAQTTTKPTSNVKHYQVFRSIIALVGFLAAAGMIWLGIFVLLPKTNPNVPDVMPLTVFGGLWCREPSGTYHTNRLQQSTSAAAAANRGR